MRRLSIALSALFLLSPLAASAAFMTPSALVTATQNGTPRSFSLSAHAETVDKTYVSIWANGTLQGTNLMETQMWTKVTVDVVSGDFTIRAKGEFMTIDGMLYGKILSIDGSMNSTFASLAANFKQKKWLKTALDMDDFSMLQNPMFSISEMNTMGPDSIFTLASKAEKNGTSYTLSLKPDAAAELALTIRELLQDTQSMSDDFFPWRDLAEGMRFEMNVKTDAKDAYLGSSYSMSTKGVNSSFRFSGTEKPAAALYLKAPTDAVGLDEIESLFMNSFPGSMEMEVDEDMMMESSEDDMMDDTETSETQSFESVDEETPSSWDNACDEEMNAVKRLMLQRDGTCPASKTPTRFTR